MHEAPISARALPVAGRHQDRTYSWIGAKASNAWTDRITKSVGAQFAAKGWVKLQSGGDAVISAFLRVNSDQNLQSYYTDFGGSWRWQGIGKTTRGEVEVGTLVIDVFDGQSKKLLWTGSATEALSDKPAKNQLEQSIGYMLRDFPKTVVRQ
jgi:hypothetical protein